MIDIKQKSQIFEKGLHFLEKENFRSHDVSDPYTSRFFKQINGLKKVALIGKYLYYPFNLMVMHQRPLLSKILGVKSHRQYPQAHAQIIRALVSFSKSSSKLGYLDQAISLGEELIAMRSEQSKHYAWGQPFDWPSAAHIMKANTPRATVSSQCAMAFLDLYEISKEERYLDIASSVCQLFVEEFHQHLDEDGDICFSYTTQDQYIIHNASMFAAAVLLRTNSHRKNAQWQDLGLKAAQFTAKHQLKQGEWYYNADPKNLNTRVDNYHTGFVLESYLDIRDYANDLFKFENVLNKGFEYYLKHFFTDNAAPRMSDHKTYPIDIQSAAQSIISLCRSKNKDHYRLAERVFEFSLNHLYNEKDSRYYYRIYKNGKTDKSSYIRWGDAWMLRAIAIMISENPESNNRI